MMISEFIERTGFEPTAKEYAEIENEYYEFDGDKNEFCKAFLKNGGRERICRERAAEIERMEQQTRTATFERLPAPRCTTTIAPPAPC